MPKAGITNITGGGGIGSDEVTATKAEVLKGYTTLTSDSGDEVATGTLELTGTTTAAHVLSGDTFYNTNAKSKLTGTLANKSAQTTAQSTSMSGSNIYTRIPQGAYITNASSGYPEIAATAPSVASAGALTAAKMLYGQTAFGLTGTATSDGTMTAARTLSGDIGYSKGSKITGTMPNRGQAQYGGGFGSGTDYYAINAIPEGAYFSNGASWAPEARVSKDVLRNALGITANKIIEGQSIADVAGTVKDYSYLATGQVSF